MIHGNMKDWGEGAPITHLVAPFSPLVSTKPCHALICIDEIFSIKQIIVINNNNALLQASMVHMVKYTGSHIN